MSAADLDPTRRMHYMLSVDRMMAFQTMARPLGLRAAMMECYEEGADKLEDHSYDFTAQGYTVYGFWLQDLANSLRQESVRL